MGKDPSRSKPVTGQVLANKVIERKLKLSRPLVTLFRLGRLSTAVALVLIGILLWGAGLATAGSVWPAIAVVTALVVLPLLLTVLLLCHRLGLYGIAEYFCGVAHWPMSVIGGNDVVQRNYHGVALIYSGSGRFEEASKYFKTALPSLNLHENEPTAPFNMRNRLPELYARMGRSDEAVALAQTEIESARRNLQDLPSPTNTANLQRSLISAAIVVEQCGQGDKIEAFLAEAHSLSLSEETQKSLRLPASPAGCAGDQAVTPAVVTSASDISSQSGSMPPAQAPSKKDSKAGQKTISINHTEILALHARGYLLWQKQDYEQAINSLEQCRDAILDSRQSVDNTFGKNNSELLGFNQRLLSQCYLKAGQTAKLEEAWQLLARENQNEPLASTDRIILDLTAADLKMSQGKGPEALAILEKTISVLTATGSTYDRHLAQALGQYQRTLQQLGRDQDAQAIESAIASLEKNTGVKNIDAASLPPPRPKALLPDLRMTRLYANRAATFFLFMIAFTIFKVLTTHEHFDYGPSLVILIFAAYLSARAIWEQSQLRKANFFADLALQKGKAIDVVIKPIGQNKPGTIFNKCQIIEGPDDLRNRELLLNINNNLIHIGKACGQVQEASLKARLYQDTSSGQVLAIETLGRVLTVNTRRRSKAAMLLKKAPE